MFRNWNFIKLIRKKTLARLELTDEFDLENLENDIYIYTLTRKKLPKNQTPEFGTFLMFRNYESTFE